MLSWWDLLWCIEGDFNVTCFPSEILGDTRFFILPWWVSLILRWALWTYILLEGILHGQTIGICFLGQELTGFLSLWIGKPSFLICLKEDYLDFAQTVFPFSLIMAVFIVAEDTLSLRTYG